jgi:hypothetical protein
MADAPQPPFEAQLLHEFCRCYPELEQTVQGAIQDSYGDWVVLEHMGDKLDEFSNQVERVSSTLHTAVLFH